MRNGAFSWFLLLGVGCTAQGPSTGTELVLDVEGSAEALEAATCLDAPGYGYCSTDAETIYRTMDVEEAYDDTFCGDAQRFHVREGAFEGHDVLCLQPVDDPTDFRCSSFDILEDETEAVLFFIDMWNTPGNTSSGPVRRFETSSTYPAFTPSGNLGAFVNRTLGPYGCQGRLIFVGHSWRVNLAESTITCDAHL